MPDPSPLQPARDGGARDRRAAAWPFGLCVAMPLASAALLLVGGELESTATLYGLYAFALSPVVWGLGLAAGIAARAQGQKARGGQILLGVCAGAAVGALLWLGAGLLMSLL